MSPRKSFIAGLKRPKRIFNTSAVTAFITAIIKFAERTVFGSQAESKADPLGAPGKDASVAGDPPAESHTREQ